MASNKIETQLMDRIKELEEWLRRHGQNCLQDQRHLIEDSTERTYWHYGYLIALRDVLRFLQGCRPDGG